MSHDEFNWLVEHSLEIQSKYAGKWIAVRDKLVVGVGDTATEAAAQARAKDPDAEFLLDAVDKEADVIYGEF